MLLLTRGLSGLLEDRSGPVLVSLTVTPRPAWSWGTGFSVSVLLHALNSLQ